MEEKITSIIKDINDAYGGKRQRFEWLDEYEFVASKEGLRLYATKLLEASLLEDESVLEYDMAENFDYEIRNVIITIRVSDTWKPEPANDTGTWKVLLFLLGTAIVAIAGMIKIYEWVR